MTFADGIEEIALLVLEPQIDLKAVFLLALQTVQSVLQLSQCVLFLKDRASGGYTASYGTGPLFNGTRGQPLLDPKHKDVFNVCLSRGEDVLIESPEDVRIRPFIPDWLAAQSQKLPIVLLPIKDLGGPFAIICGISKNKEAFKLVNQFVTELRLLRTQLANTGRAIR